MSPRTLIVSGALLSGLAVGLGAFAAHGLEGSVTPRDGATFETGARYQMYHGLALLLLAALPPGHRRLRAAAAWCFVLGTLLFSGSLYLLVLTGPRWLGAVTPVGGTLFLAGWVALAASARRAG